jgi:hypothetical protein
LRRCQSWRVCGARNACRRKSCPLGLQIRVIRCNRDGSSSTGDARNNVCSNDGSSDLGPVGNEAIVVGFFDPLVDNGSGPDTIHF